MSNSFIPVSESIESTYFWVLLWWPFFFSGESTDVTPDIRDDFAVNNSYFGSFAELSVAVPNNVSFNSFVIFFCLFIRTTIRSIISLFLAYNPSRHLASSITAPLIISIHSFSMTLAFTRTVWYSNEAQCILNFSRLSMMADSSS